MLTVLGEVKKEADDSIVASKLAYMEYQGLRVW